MRANRTLEIGTGLFVLLGFAALVFLTTQLPSSGLKLSSAKSGYRVTAEFDNIGDLKSGAPVTMAGVRIGEVESVGIDPQTYRALVTLRIDPQYNQIPDDSDAAINTQGLLGGQYVAIGPGGSEMYLMNGSRIQFTQNALVLENIINKLFASFAGKSSESSPSSGGNGGGAASGTGASSPGNHSGGGAGGKTGHR
ncbi:MAG TPA: outer membrane lipid asymmetry maintenance protein MlaD [Steroidobacteraceae bacterium]|nr:outer membrane lipid asymmetry maintenance protein MlaD [Steroidobacteraceae bacterium]